MTSMGVPLGLLAVQLDDELLAHGYVDVLAERELADGDLSALGAGLQPGRRDAVEHVAVPLDDDHRLGLLRQGDHVALAHPVAGDVDPLAVHGDVAVADQLARLGPGGAPAGAVPDVVEAQLQVLEHLLAGDARAAAGLGVDPAELLLGQAVGEAGLLLFGELQEVVGLVAPAAAAAVLTGRVRAALEGVDLALGAPDVDAEAAGDAGAGAGVA